MLRNLYFRDSSMENDFLLTRQKYHIIGFRKLIASFVLQSCAIYFSNPFELNILEANKLIPFLAIMCLIVAFYLAVMKKYVKNCSSALLFCVLIFSVGTTEIINYLRKEILMESWVFFLLGSYLQTGCLFLLISRVKWIHSLIIVSIIQTFSLVRILDVFNNKGVQKTAIISMALNVILLSSVNFSNEKGDRSCFQKLKSQHHQLEAFEELITNVIPTSIIIMNEEKIDFINEGAKNLLGVTERSEAATVLGKIRVAQIESCSEFVGNSRNRFEPKSKDYGSIFDLIRKCALSIKNGNVRDLKSFTSVEGEFNRDLEESTQSLACQIGPTLWKGKMSVVIILSDISSIKNHYKNLDIYKDNLLATVSHDLRTPLNGMLGMLELMMEETEEDSKREKIVVTMSSAKLLLNMINDILDFSLISKGKLRLKFDTTNVTCLIEETVKILQMQARMKGLDLLFKNQLEDKDETFIIDGSRVRQVLLNLIGNAIKFTNSGEIIVSLKQETISDERKPISSDGNSANNTISFKEPALILDKSANGIGKCLLFEVSDTGIGIKSTDQSRLFKLFSRVDVEEGQNKNGIGLGLAISQRLVCMMNSNRQGGNISVRSEYGKGSKFFFRIFLESEPSVVFKEYIGLKDKTSQSLETNTPYFFKKNSSPTLNLSPSLRLESDGDCLLSHDNRRKYVLVVDDDQINILVAKSYLKSLDEEYLVITANNGKEALEKINDAAKDNIFFDIILMDCNMPVMDGYEASEKIVSIMNANLIPRVPIVAITANVGNNDKDKCLAHGMEFFLTKPYSKAQLLKTLKDSLKTEI